MPDLIVQNLKCLTCSSKEVHHPQGGLSSQTLPAECHTLNPNRGFSISHFHPGFGLGLSNHFEFPPRAAWRHVFPSCIHMWLTFSRPPHLYLVILICLLHFILFPPPLTRKIDFAKWCWRGWMFLYRLCLPTNFARLPFLASKYAFKQIF